jgi:hypothetical protein
MTTRNPSVRGIIARAALSTMILALGLCALAGAQPKMGDILIADNTSKQIVYIDRSSNLVQTLASGLPKTPISMTMARNNADLIVLGGTYVFNVTPSGQLTTVVDTGAANGANNGCGLLQDGTYAISASIYGKAGYVKVVDPVAKSVSTLYQASLSHFRSLDVNEDNGNVLVCRWDVSGDLFEFDMVHRTLRTIKSGFYGLNGVDVEPASGNYVCSLHYSTGGIQVISPTGSVVSTIRTPWGNGVKVDDATGHYLYVNGTGSSAINTVTEYDRKGTAISTYGPFTGYDIKFVDVYGSRQVTGSGSATPRSAYTVDFCFPGGAGTTYVGALALSQRPGFMIGGSTLNLAPDALFWLSVQGFFVSRFQGILDTSGRASGTIHLPSFMPQGMTIYCSAIATNGISFVTGNTIGITIR